MTNNEYHMIEKANWNAEKNQLEERLEMMNNLVKHLRNKFIGLANELDRSSACRDIEHIIEYIDNTLESLEK